jgi:hypothetical protein
MRAEEPGKKLQSLLEEAGFYPQAAGTASAWRGKIH